MRGVKSARVVGDAETSEGEGVSSTVAGCRRRRGFGVGSGCSAGSLWSFFFGNGTAEHPDGGILIGNGYSWTALTCTSGDACDGGDGGIFR